MSPLFEAWAERVLRHRFVALAIIAALTALAIHTARTRAVVDTTVEAFLSETSETGVILEEFRDEFGRDDVFMILAEGDVFSLPYLRKLKTLHERLEVINTAVDSLGYRRGEGEAPTVEPAAAASDAFADLDDDFGDDEGWGEEAGGSIVDEVASLMNARLTLATEEGIDVRDLLDPFPTTAAAVADLKAQTLGDPARGVPENPALVGRIVGKAGRISALLVRTDFMSEADSVLVLKDLEAAFADLDAPGFEIHVAGMTALSTSLMGLMQGDLKRLFLVSLVVLLLILLVIFRSPLGAFAPMMVVALSALWSFATAFALGMPMTMISNVLPAFFICVGVADSVHLLSVYRDERAATGDNHQAIVAAVASTGVPIFYTSLTTAIGLLSFQLATVGAIGDMGLTGAIGVTAAFLLTITLLPIVLTFNRRNLFGGTAPGADRVERFLQWSVGLSAGPRRRSVQTLVVAAVMAGAAVYGGSLLRVWHNPLSWMPQEEPIIVAVDKADAELGGAANIQLLMRAQGPRGVKDVGFLQGLEALERRIKAYEDPASGAHIVGATISLLDPLRESNRALRGGGQEHYRVPATQPEVDAAFFAFENSALDQLKRLMTINARTAQMTITVKWLEATAYLPLATYLDDAIAELIPAGTAVVKPTGSVFTMLSTVGALIMDLLRSFGFAFLVITLVMVLLLKTLKLGLIAMVPNLLPIVFILGLMGFADIPIDMANLMIASIALGIAVDDTVHLLHHFRAHFAEHGDREAAIAHAVRHAGRAIVVTSVILATGFFVYLAATMVNLQRFGALIGLTVIFAVVLDLTLAPALLRLTYADKADKAD